jgi:hypothetical protein
MQREEDGRLTVSQAEAERVRAALWLAVHHFDAEDVQIFTGEDQTQLRDDLVALDAAVSPDEPARRARALQSHFDLLQGLSRDELRSARRRRHVQAVVREGRALGVPVPNELGALADE